jgi:ABC-type lipoprotein export system ATPase subunit
MQSEAARLLLPRLGLPERLFEAPVAQLSSGERQRLALIRAVIRRPRVLLLDEPTAALDEASARHVEALLIELRQNGTGLIVVTHNEAQASRLATQRFQMRERRLHEIAL